jgi:hypothetical protein
MADSVYRQFLIDQIAAGNPLEQSWRRSLASRATHEVEALYWRCIAFRYGVQSTRATETRGEAGDGVLDQAEAEGHS